MAHRFKGQLQTESDVDWFAFPCCGRPDLPGRHNEGTVNIMQADGSRLNNASEFGFEKKASFIAETDGTMYVQVGSSFDGRDGYELTIVQLFDAPWQ